MDAGQKGLMKGLIKTGLVFSAVLVATMAIIFVLPVFAGPGITLTSVAPSPGNNSNFSTVGLATGYLFVNFTVNESLVSIPILQVYNISGDGNVGNFPMTVNGTDATENYASFNVTGLFNGTFEWIVTGVNTSSLGDNQTFGNFTVTLGEIYKYVITNPVTGTTTNDVTPELRVSANSTFLTNMTLTFYATKAGVTQARINTTILNGTETYFNMTELNNGTYTITAELGNGADFPKVNTTAITLTVRHLEASASVGVASVNAGAKQNYTFTITNNGTDDNTDSIDMINITYTTSGYADPAVGDIVCPTTTSLWNRSVDATVNSIVCLLPGPGDDKITAGVAKTIKVENWSATNTAGLKLFSVAVRGSIGGGTKTIADSASTSVYGNLSFTGTSRVATTTLIGSTNLTVISFNFSATGEQMNISSITVTRTGTVTDADIVSVALYNSTQENAQTFNETLNIDPLAVNTSAPTVGAYTFSGLSFVVPSSQILMVVFNVSSSATGGGVFGAGIVNTASVTTTGGASGQSITETLATHVSDNSTIYGTLAVTGTDRVSGNNQIGTNNVTLVSFNLSAIGEAMTISEILLQLNGTSIAEADIQSITLYNSTDPSTATYNGSQTVLKVNSSAPTSLSGLVYNLSGFGLTVPAGPTGQIVLVVVNVSSGATAGHAVNATILSNANIVTNSVSSGQGITETLTSASSSSSIITGTLAVTGTNRAATTTQIGTKNITVISFNFSATGEQMNITSLNITFNGTHTTDDVVRVGLYNSSADEAGLLDGSGVDYDLIQWNISEPVNGRYNFTNLGFNVSAGTTNVLLVVINLTDWAIGGHNFNVSIEGATDVVTVGGGSNVAITETFTTQRSSSSTIYGNLSVTGTNIAPTAADVGQIGVGLLKLTLNSTGEMINVTTFNITSNSTSNTDVLAVRLFGDTGGATTGTYERGNDLPIAGASGVFTGSSVILTPTTPIQVENNTLSYVYVVVDVNTSATVGLNRLGVSIQGASAITALGNDSNVSLTPQLITGDPGGTASIRNLTATAFVVVTGSATAQVEIAKLNNYTLTLNNTGVGTPSDSIDEIRILFGGTGFTLEGNATCPTIGGIAWNRTVLGANTIVCNVTDGNGRLPIDKNTTVIIENFTAGATAGVMSLNISVRGAMGGIFNITSSRPAITVYGNATVRVTNRVNATVQIGTGAITLASFNLSATGESMNVSELVLMVNGTSISSADIQSITLYNSTDPSTTIVNGSQTLFKTNTSVTETPTSLTYNFSSLGLSVPTGVTGQIVLVVINVSSSATGGHTINGTILSTDDAVIVGGLTGANVAETLGTKSSSSTTVFGTLAVTGTSRISSTTAMGSTNVTVISFNFTATGEAMNITSLNITFNGTHTTDDIVRVGLYNSSEAAAGVLDGSGVNYDLIAWNNSEPVNGRYNFTNLGFNVSAGGTNVLLVVINVSSTSTGGHTINVSIEDATDVVTVGGGSNAAITETFTSQRSDSSVVTGALTITGTSRVASYTRLGSTNVTVISFNFSATGEQMNISSITVARTGTVTDADIVSVALYNSTQENAQTFNETLNIDPLAVNTSAPTAGAYTFSGLSFVVPSSQILMVVFNVSSSATGGGVFGAGIVSDTSVTTTGGASGQSITETLATHVSDNSTLSALAVTGGSIAPSLISVGQSATGFLNLTFVATGETMNITSINITLTGNGTALNLSDVRIYRDESTAPGRFDSSDTFLSREIVNGDSGTVQLNLTPDIYNVSIPIGSTMFFVTYNVSAIALNGSTIGAQIIPSSSVAAVGNASGLAISVTGSSLASTNATIQSQASLTFGTVTSSVRWLTNSTTGVNSTTITVPVTNAGQSTANLTSVVATMYNALTAENASTNFTIIRADSVSSLAGGVTTALNFTANTTTDSQLDGLVNVSITLLYNDSNTFAVSVNSPSETNTSGLFGLDGAVPTSEIITPSNNVLLKGTRDINFTLNDTRSGINSSSLVFLVNGTSRTATCTPSGLNFTCTFSWETNNGTYDDGVYTVNVSVSDNSTNAAIKSEVNVTVDNTAPAFSGDNVTVSLINTTITTLFSVNITERNFNASNTFIGVRNLTNSTIRNMAASCASLGNNVWRCNATWNGQDDSSTNVADGNYTFIVNSTDNASTYGAFNSTLVVTFTSDTAAPSVTGSGPSTAATVTTSTPALLVNTTESATCKWDTADMAYSSMSNTFTGTSTTHNYTLSSQTDGVKAFYVRCQDTIGNAMTTSSVIWFSIDTRGNYNYTQPTTGYFATGWNTLFIPTQTIIETTGRNSTSTGSFNFTSVLDSLSTNWNYMYYNINGTSTGWVLATRTDPGGSTLKYVNNTNDKPYYINITASNTRFTL